MRKVIKFYPVIYKVIAIIACFLIVLIYNRSRAAVTHQEIKQSTYNLKREITSTNNNRTNFLQRMIDRVSAKYTTEVTPRKTTYILIR